MAIAPVIYGLVFSQVAVNAMEVHERHQSYAKARAASEASGKPLVVVGGSVPSSTLLRAIHWRSHGCGDTCIDLDPGACWGCPNFIQADIRNIPLPDRFAGAAFASHVLEHLPTVADAEKALIELHRIGDQVFIAYPSKLNLVAWGHPEHHLWVYQAADGVVRFEQR